MGLPWFAFDIKDFIANTLRLNTEAKGAYLMLMLDYYEREQAPPDDNRVLATITGLHIDAWMVHRPVIEPLFETVTGTWTHSRIEAEIEKGRGKHAQRMNALTAASASRGIKPPKEPKQPKPAAPVAAPVTEPVTVREPARETARSTHKQEQVEEVVSNDTTSVRAGMLASIAGDMPLPDDFALTGSDVIRCQSEGYSGLEIGEVLDGFKRYHAAAGTFSDDWPAIWWRWWERKKPAQMPKAKPRIEVSARAPSGKTKGFPIPPDWKPNQRHAEMCAERGISINDIEETFRDYCAQAKNRDRYSDHDAAFRTFIKNDTTFTRGSKPNGQTPNRGSITDAGNAAIAALDRRIAEAESDHGGGEQAVQELPQDGLRQPAGGAGDDGHGA